MRLGKCNLNLNYVANIFLAVFNLNRWQRVKETETLIRQ